MDYILKKGLLVLILSFVITEENNLKCVTNEVYDFVNKTHIKIAIDNFKILDLILKRHKNDTIDLILSRMDLPNLEYVKINNSYINKLDLSENNIKAMPEDFFSRLKFIIEINLSGNAISDLTNLYINIDKNLCAFLFLEKLDLSYNNIYSLNGTNFDKLKNLKVLNLLGNKIEILSIFDLNKLNQVKELLLGNEEMIIDKDFSFENFSNLESLELRDYKFRSLNSYLFTGLKNLSCLFLGRINLSNVTENIFFELKKLKILALTSVAENKNQFFDIFSYFFAPDNLEFLDISENNLKSLDFLNFSQFSKLKTLISSNNNVRKINKITFHGMTELIFVDLSQNNIESLDFDVFFEGNKILDFRIYSNKIKKVEFNFF